MTTKSAFWRSTWRRTAFKPGPWRRRQQIRHLLDAEDRQLPRLGAELHLPLHLSRPQVMPKKRNATMRALNVDGVIPAFVRWRPDKAPTQCTFEQLPRAETKLALP